MSPLFLRAVAALVPALLLAGSPAVAGQEQHRPITHEDVWLMKRPGAVAVSPNGRWIVVSVSDRPWRRQRAPTTPHFGQVRGGRPGVQP
jgi:hypothetical protein